LSFERAYSFLWRRAMAYRRIFLNHGFDTTDVLADLAKFCRAHESTFHPTSAISDRLDGRREVWLRIQQHLNLSNDELWKLYGNTRLQSEFEPKE
jgi:hypothetical protein